MYFLVQILVPISICVVLPVLVVWLICRASMNGDNKRAQVLIEAIKADKNIDPQAIIEAFGKKKKSFQEKQVRRLLLGTILSFIGIVFTVIDIIALYLNYINVFSFLYPSIICLGIGLGYLVVYFISKKTVTTGNDE